MYNNPVRHTGKQEVLIVILIVPMVVLGQLVCEGGYFLIKGMWSGGGVGMDGWMDGRNTAPTVRHGSRDTRPHIRLQTQFCSPPPPSPRPPPPTTPRQMDEANIIIKRLGRRFLFTARLLGSDIS